MLVVGATGYFGRLLVEDLVQHTALEPVLGGRRADALSAAGDELGLAHAVCDLHDAGSLDDALEGVDAAVCAAGPFQGLPTTLAERCLARGLPYVDLADDRDAVLRTRALVAGRPDAPPLLAGWSAVSALSAALARIAAQELGALDRIDIHIAPGNKQPRAAATVASLLDSVGRSFSVRRDGREVLVSGWTERRIFPYPPQLGERSGYLVDVPDHVLLPPLFDDATVEFRVGAEIAPFNGAMALLAWLRRRGVVRDWARYTPLLQRCMSLAGWLGTERGGMGVVVQGQHGRRRAVILAETGGQRIPVLPASVVLPQVLASDAPGGLWPHDTWIDETGLADACTARGFDLVVETLS